jgi:hypothetical protein
MLPRIAVACLVFAISLSSQTADFATVTVQNVLASSFSAAPPQQLKLEGTAIEHIGGDNAGSFSAVITNTGRMAIDFKFGTGSRQEVFTGVADDPNCYWIDGDGLKHETPLHNCWSINNWLIPPMSFVTPSKTTVQTDTTESRETVIVVRRDMSNRTRKVNTQSEIEKLSQFRITLDPKTNVPSALEFFAHPDDDAGVDIPVRVEYADYRNVDGVMLPGRIAKYFNGNLLLELTVTSATSGSN